jgi:tetratricopeptide (TPR) repeat protein
VDAATDDEGPRGRMRAAGVRRLVLVLCALALVGAASEIERLEQERDKRPNDAERREALGEAYYREARAALDRGDFAAYEKRLGQAMDEVLESARLEPESASPHVFMGIVAAYQGDLDRTLQSLANARRLAPRAWTSYTNLAETMIYRGSPRRDVETWIDRAERLGANPAVVELNLCLVSWRDGNLEAAERHFQRVKRLDPKVLESWNEAPVPKPIATLSDLMGYCCGSPACGPYLADACKQSQLEVARREIPAEVARRELVVEMERRRKLEEIYSQRKDLEIKVEKPEPVQ